MRGRVCVGVCVWARVCGRVCVGVCVWARVCGRVCMGARCVIFLSLSPIQSSQAYYFFVVLSNCDASNPDSLSDDAIAYSQGSIDVEIDFLFTNGVSADSKHFSADEIGVYTMTIVFFVFQLILTAGAAMVCIALKNRRKLHLTVKVFMVSVLLQLFGLLLLMVHYSSFSDDGFPRPKLLSFALTFLAMSDTCMVLVLIMLAKGLTIVRRKISIPGRIKMSIFATVYFMTSLTVIIWRHITTNSATEVRKAISEGHTHVLTKGGGGVNKGECGNKCVCGEQHNVCVCFAGRVFLGCL